MNFQPVLPLSGYPGWLFLNRTLETQQTAHDNTQQIKRETAYFEKNIGRIQTAEALVQDRTLLKVALGAFGLDDDIGNKFFIRKVLEDGTLERSALSNRLADKRYFEFSKAFGFGDFSTPNTQLSDFGARIAEAYKERQFEVAVGDQDENMRLALGAQRELDALTKRDISDNAMWFTVMGNAPLRNVFETALGLPSSFGSLDLDKQLEVFRDRAERQFGAKNIAQFADPEKQEELVRNFLIRADIQNQNISILGGQTALALLESASAIRPFR
ncbi:DUF1217 domain-containing protein [Pseudohalocynthiibacter aestuariivivens]|uniref:DUF1217 domain-containing protein n=1 Tax=Pseudohalocynthiibacter aestuariivivens TaxID=1591409 RepID=A0ABV5JLU5_9RHOB|nr:DUF1217 domain-containing protein [Pseudohalocynthiibacter aestuariivivens]MBS9717730.1 DUF1217 domain-containing protein [Pseudohalocynthiibacter aestuariivivens]